MSGSRDIAERALRWVGERCGLAVSRPSMPSDSASRRVLLYAASVVGLGHMLRLVRIATRLRELVPGVEILLISDHPNLSSEQLGAEIATVKLPGYRFREGSFQEEPAALGLTCEQLYRMRVNIIMATVASFQPHAFLMDTAPHGKRNELKPALKWLGRSGTRATRILQLRDIPFPPEDKSKVNPSLARLRTEHEFYDRIFVAGNETFCDVVNEYDLPSEIARKIEYVGFVIPNRRSARGNSAGVSGSGTLPGGDAALQAMLNNPARRIVAGFGGGWEADTLAPAVLDAFERLIASAPNSASGKLQLFMFTGPRIGDKVSAEIERRISGRDDIYISRFSSSFSEVLARADLAFLQAGSSIYQILDGDQPAILYARDFKTSEQQQRAERLARWPGIRLIDQNWMGQNSLADLMTSMLAAPRAARHTGYDFNGVQRAAESIAAILKRQRQISNLSA